MKACRKNYCIDCFLLTMTERRKPMITINDIIHVKKRHPDKKYRLSLNIGGINNSMSPTHLDITFH